MNPTDTRAQESQLPTLTSLRWVAALLVFAYHAGAENLFANHSVGRSLASVTAKAGAVGVSFFFVLSGFVLTWSAREGEPIPTFWRRRIAKIYPNHIASFIVALLLILRVGPLLPGGRVWSGAAANLFLVQAWIPNPYVFISVNGVSWSLSCEIFFYLTFPFWLGVVRRIPAQHLVWGFALLVVLILGVPLVAAELPREPELPWKAAPTYAYWFVYIFPPIRMLEFVIGIILARMVREGRFIRVKLSTATLLFAVSYFGALHVPYLFAFVAATVVPIALVIAAGAQADLQGLQSQSRQTLVTRLGVWLGEISFAFYLVHRLVLIYGHHAIVMKSQWSTPTALGLIVFALGVSIALSVVLHRVVEQPAMRRFGTRHPTTPSAVTWAVVARKVSP